MKDSVCVGLTMKSIDYFQHGLPIINNIKADTTELVEEYKVGFNEIDFEKELLSKKIQNLSVDDVIEMKKMLLDYLMKNSQKVLLIKN